MTKWKKCKITGREVKNHEIIGDCVCLHIDRYVQVKGSISCVDYIVVADYPPFNTWQIDDYIEINLDEMINRSPIAVLKNTSIVRKVSSSAVVSSSSSNQQITSNQIQERDERMRRWVEESGGEYEADFTARQEYRTDGSIGAHELKWTYRKK